MTNYYDFEKDRNDRRKIDIVKYKYKSEYQVFRWLDLRPKFIDVDDGKFSLTNMKNRKVV